MLKDVTLEVLEALTQNAQINKATGKCIIHDKMRQYPVLFQETEKIFYAAMIAHGHPWFQAESLTVSYRTQLAYVLEALEMAQETD